MTNPATRQLLRRHAVAFAVSFVSLTSILIANYAAKRLPELRASGAQAGTIVDVVLLAVPFTAAITIPMAVFIAVLWVFTRFGAEGTLAAVRRERYGVRRLVAPVLGAAAAVAALTLVSNAQIVPRANARLAALLARGAFTSGDRMMTIGQLQAAAHSARADARPESLVRAASYEVEIQKKYALAAACVVLALAGAAIAFRFPRGGGGLVIGASLAVFSSYYVCLIVGESLADRLVVSPFASMWTANALLLAAALLIMWRSRWPGAPAGVESLAIAVALTFETAGCSRGIKDHDAAFPTTGVRFFAAARLTGSADSLLVIVTARNDAGTQRALESGMCGNPLVLRVYRGPRPRRGSSAPVWDSELWHRAMDPPNSICLPVAAVTVLAPGDSSAVAGAAFPVRAVLGDSLPIGLYRVTAVFHGELDAGTVELRAPPT